MKVKIFQIADRDLSDDGWFPLPPKILVNPTNEKVRDFMNSVLTTMLDIQEDSFGDERFEIAVVTWGGEMKTLLSRQIWWGSKNKVIEEILEIVGKEEVPISVISGNWMEEEWLMTQQFVGIFAFIPESAINKNYWLPLIQDYFSE